MMVNRENVGNMETILEQQSKILKLFQETLEREGKTQNMLNACMKAILDLQDRVIRLEKGS